LKALQDQAIAFRATADADPEWREDEGQVDRHNQLLSDVNAAVADFQDAQRRCANSILALYSDRRYVAENGDGTIADNEFGYSKDMLDAVLAQGEGLPWGRVGGARPRFSSATSARSSAASAPAPSTWSRAWAR
jgi:hypothetical protein